MKTDLITFKNSLLIATLVAIFIGAIYLSQWLSTSDQAVQLIKSAGYPGLVFLGLVGGLNFLVPIPPATFSALYTAAGLSTIGIVLALAVGTLLADLLGFWFGTKARPLLADKYPKIVSCTEKVADSNKLYILAFVASYAAFVPFPNEAILIPLALVGVHLRLVVPALLVGNILHQAILIYGVDVLGGIFG